MTDAYVNGIWVGIFIGCIVGMFFTGIGLTVTNTTYTDGQIDALSGNNIMVEKVENERGELVWQMK